MDREGDYKRRRDRRVLRQLFLPTITGFKFRDYYTAFGATRSPLVLDHDIDLNSLLESTQTLPDDIVQNVKSNLREAFTALSGLLPGPDEPRQ